jgi:RNA polymerase sigma-70 factor (ECF subfamily)
MPPGRDHRQSHLSASDVSFPATRWTLVNRAAGADAVAQPLAIAELVRAYAPALRAHLMQWLRCDAHRADDLLQGFLTDKVLEQRLIGHADPKRGRFRTFLLAALNRYVVDRHRHDTARKRAPRGGMLDIAELSDDVPAPVVAPGAVSAFDAAFAREVVGEVLSAMRWQCGQTGRADLWDVFEARYLKPATENTAPEPHESIARRLNLPSPQHAANLLVTAKRMFTRLFKIVVGRYAADQDEVRDEVSELWRLFAAGER